MGKGGASAHAPREASPARADGHVAGYSRQLREADPELALPVQHAQGMPIPADAQVARRAFAGVAAHRRNHLAAEPAANAAQVRAVEEDERRIGAGFAHQQPLDQLAILQAQPARAHLVVVQPIGQALGAGMAHQPAQVVEDEPDLVIEQYGAEQAAMAEEVEGGG